VAFKQKDGNLKAFLTHDTTSITLDEIISENIETESEIHTDEYNSYNHNHKIFSKKRFPAHT
jgi:hypothetical protein